MKPGQATAKSGFFESVSKESSAQKSVSASERNGVEIQALLNGLLANEMALFVKTLNYHWNVQGPRFRSIHLFLDEQYNNLLKMIDETAERIRMIDGAPIGTVEEISDLMGISERPKVKSSADEMLNDLLMDHLTIQAQIVRSLKSSDLFDGDPATQDFLVKRLALHEKMSWMLKSHFH